MNTGVICLLGLLCALQAFGSPVPLDDQIPVEDVTFQLFTKKNPEEGFRIVTGDSSTLTEGGFDPTLPTKILVHGWMDDMFGGVIQRCKKGEQERTCSHGHATCNTIISNINSYMENARKSFMTLEPMNVIGVGWPSCARNVLYDEATVCAQQVGQYIGELVVWLGSVAGVRPQDVHIIAHSLGCQVAGYASNIVKVGHITALDPAAPLFAHVDTSHHIDAGDADFVDVFHTSIKLVGMKDAVGHVDFYPNGGSEQPGCGGIFGGCAHSAAYQFYAHTIYEETREEYMAYQCETVDDARNTTCTGEPMQLMGYGVNPELRGIFYSNITYVPA